MYKMKLNETISIKEHQITIMIITRVPGGWIYEMKDGNYFRPVFVPYDSEFKHKALNKDHV